MVKWFRSNETNDFGSYSQKIPNRSARHFYNNLMSAASLLWITEAVGANELTVQRAYKVAVATGDYRHACDTIHKIITWYMIYALS